MGLAEKLGGLLHRRQPEGKLRPQTEMDPLADNEDFRRRKEEIIALYDTERMYISSSVSAFASFDVGMADYNFFIASSLQRQADEIANLRDQFLGHQSPTQTPNLPGELNQTG